MKKWLIFLIFILFISCKNYNFGPEVIDVLSPPEGTLKNLSEIALDIEYIPLETTENSLISYIHDIKLDRDKFYIYILNEILCFDKQGRYLYKLDKKGRGPEEYVYIYDWDIDSEKGLLLILTNKKIIFYKDTGKNFEYNGSLKLAGEVSRADFIPGQNSILLSSFSSSGNDDFRNNVINLNGDTLTLRPNYYKFQQVNKIGFDFIHSNLHYKYNNFIYFKEVTCDTIFKIDKTIEIKPHIVLYSHGLKPDQETFANMSMERLRERVNIQRIFEVQRYIIYRMLYNDSSFGIYDKKTSTKKEISAYNFLEDDIAGGINFEPKFSDGSVLISWVDSYELKQLVSNKNFENTKVKNAQKKNELKKLADSLKETDNPVLVIVTPKN